MITQLRLDLGSRFIFSKREYEVLRGIVNGKTLQQIAHEMKLNVRTVKGYLAGIKAKMGADSKKAALKKAIDLGLVII